ncbi:hypothetical protein [Halarcobacter sp.]|uniref:hypothetical protein n=1 Tax=Halarcobacter sp. TaxID=2321133 RepID=UPI003AFFCC7F
MTINIEWEGSYSLKDLENKKLNNTNIDYGIYQIYGNHPIYGNDVLLYIGKANQQTFNKRLNQEQWWWLNEDANNLKIYVGRLFAKEQPSFEEWEKMIDIAEKMLIYSHSPAMNSSNIFSISRDKEILKKYEDVRIFNFDNYRSLMPEVSGEMWIKEFDFEYNGVFSLEKL